MPWTLREHQTEPDRLAHLLYWQQLLDQDDGTPGEVVWQTDSSLLSVLSYRGPDMESADAHELIALNARLHGVVLTLKDGWTAHTEARRQPAAAYPARTWNHPVAALVDEERRAMVGAPESHFETTYHLALTRQIPRTLGSWWQRLWWEHIPEGHARTNAVTSFREEIARVLGQLRGIFPDDPDHTCQVLAGDALCAYLKNTVSAHSQAYVHTPEPPWYLNYQLTDSPLQGGVTPKLGDQWVRVVLIKNERRQIGFPSTTYPGILDVLHDLPLEYRYVERWIPLSYAKARKELSQLEDMYRGQHKAFGTQAMEKMTGKASPKIEQAADNDAAAMSEARGLLDEGVVNWGHLTLSVVVWDTDFARAEQKREQVEQALRAKGFLASVEILDTVGAWLGTLPGDSYHNVERPLLHSLNMTHLMPTTSVWSGPTTVPHLKGSPWLVATARGHTPFRLTTHEGDVGDFFIISPKGCLAGDTFIQFHIIGPSGERGSHLGGTIETLYRRVNHLPQKRPGPKPRNEDVTFWAPSMNDEGKIQLNRILAVMYTGDQPCFRLTTASGQVIVATADHRFFTGQGYTRLENLSIGDSVYVHTNKHPGKQGRRDTTIARDVFTVKHHPYAPIKMVNGYIYHRLQKSRGIYEAHLNNLSVHEYVARLNAGTTEGMDFLSPAIHIHHKNEDIWNNTIENFELIDPVAHSRHHALKRNVTQLRFITSPDYVVSIEPVGMHTTYDMQMEAPYHNYVANNIVTHNSGKSTHLALMALQWDQYASARVMALDKGGSLKGATLAMDGQWVDLAPGTARPLQPLARIHDAEERAWAVEWIEDLLTLEGLPCEPVLSRELWDAMQALVPFPMPQRTLSGFSALVQSQQVREALRRYTVDGPFPVLDGDEDWLQVGRFTCFEMEKLLDDFPRLVHPVAKVLFRRVETALDGAPTLISVDECHAYFQVEVLAARLLAWLKTLRRRNAILGFSTQNLLDVKRSPVGQELIQACPTRIYGANPHALEPAVMALYQEFGLSPRQCQLIAQLVPKFEFYYQGQQGCRRYRLDHGPASLAFCGRSRTQDLRDITKVYSESPNNFAESWLRFTGLHEEANLLREAFNA